MALACAKSAYTLIRNSLIQRPTFGTCRILKQADSSKCMANFCRTFSALTLDKPSSVITRQPVHSQRSVLLKSQVSAMLPSTSMQIRTRTRRVKAIVHHNRKFKKIYYNIHTGEPEAMQHVIDRFYRLHNGQWIRTKAGRNKRKYKKSLARNRRAEEHVMCNRQQCQMLDQMVTEEWKRKTYFPEDPYNPYHSLQNLPLYRYKPPRFLP